MQTKRCKQCGTEFQINDAEMDFYRKNGLELPRRCKQCRSENRARRENTNAPQESKSPTADAKPKRERTPVTRLPRWVPLLFALLLSLGLFGGGTALYRLLDSAEAAPASVSQAAAPVAYAFRSDALLQEHYQKHGADMGFDTAKDYQTAAAAVAADPASQHKTEAEDGDDVYYRAASNDFVIVSTDGYLRTYFRPADGQAYFDRQ